MWYVDLVLAPLLALSLAVSAAALAAKCRCRWYTRGLTLFTKISFTVFTVVLLLVIALAEWYLYRRFSAALWQYL